MKMEVAKEKSQEQIQHESNKVVRNSLAWLHYKMTSQQFFLEEAQEALQARGVLELICKDLQAKIELIEPPPPKEEEAPKAPYVIDAGTVKAD
jgi:isochorismate synthase EntC